MTTPGRPIAGRNATAGRRILEFSKFFIDGQWVEPISARALELVNPATEQVYATAALGSVADVHRAVLAAREAVGSFSQTTPAERADLIERIVALLVRDQNQLLAAIVQEMGAPISMTAQVEMPTNAFRQAIKTLRAYDFERTVDGHIVRREAIGVCGLIAAWNWPMQNLCSKLAYALAAGCAVVAKPSEFTPGSALLLAGLLTEAGVPKGVFNLVPGDGPTVGRALSAHMDIDMVSITGSTRAGILVAEAAAPSVKRVAQELGGKSAHIVLPGADLAAAARWNVARGFANASQSCHAPTRILVRDRDLEPFLESVVSETAKIRVGDPLDPQTTMGPLANAAQFDKVQKYIQLGIEQGARLVTGGPGKPTNRDTGYFVQPTVFADVAPEMSIAEDEIFGPVLSVISYRNEDQAIEIANASRYGLGGYVSGPDRDSGLRVARQIKAGRIFFNNPPDNPAAPLGGYKQSGNGRELGVFGLEEYLEVKAMIGF